MFARRADADDEHIDPRVRRVALADAVELAETSLKETGKNPIRSPKHFKNAEIKTRGLLRTLDAFERDMNAADRSMIEKTKGRVQEAHDRLLQDIMTGKKK